MRPARTSALPLSYPEQPVHRFVSRSAQTWPDRTALLFEDLRFTYRELDGVSSALAAGLAARGVRAGQRVAIYLGNEPEWVLSLLAVSKLDAVAMLLSPAWRSGEVTHAFSLARPDALITDTVGLERAAAAGLPDVVVVGDLDLRGSAPSSLPSAPSGLWDLVSTHTSSRRGGADGSHLSESTMLFSSGTTSAPKGVRHTHRSITVGTAQWKSAMDLGDGDVLQLFTPLSHVLGLVTLLGAFEAGATVRLMRRFAPDVVADSLERDGVTISVAVAPAVIALNGLPDLDRRDLTRLRYLAWCATPVTDAVAAEFTARTGARMLTAYGTTELPVLFSNLGRYPDLWRTDTVGVPVADVQARILDLTTHEPLPSGQVGELVVRSESAMFGYLPDEATAGAFLPDGWYRTGDVGWMEPEGWLHLTDRLKEIIKVSGFQVAPAEIESVLFQHPAVQDCAVFGVPDPQRGEGAVAVVVLRPGARTDEDELIRWAGENLAGYKRLRRIVFCDAVPRNPTGKTVRRDLTARFADLLDADASGQSDPPAGP